MCPHPRLSMTSADVVDGKAKIKAKSKNERSSSFFGFSHLSCVPTTMNMNLVIAWSVPLDSTLPLCTCQRMKKHHRHGQSKCGGWFFYILLASTMWRRGRLPCHVWSFVVHAVKNARTLEHGRLLLAAILCGGRR
jgi:hypothetical protein